MEEQAFSGSFDSPKMTGWRRSSTKLTHYPIFKVPLLDQPFLAQVM